MTQLTEEQKESIVQALAEFKRPAEVVVMMREEWDVELTVRQVIGYDPSRPAFDASDKWREIFQARRIAYLEDVRSVPIAHQAYRLHSLQNIHDKALAQGNLVLAAQTLEHAAKEVGGLFSNLRLPDLIKKSPTYDMTPDERREKVTQILREALEAKSAESNNKRHSGLSDIPAGGGMGQAA